MEIPEEGEEMRTNGWYKRGILYSKERQVKGSGQKDISIMVDISQRSLKKLEKTYSIYSKWGKNKHYYSIRLTSFPFIGESYDPIARSEEEEEEASYSISNHVCNSVPAWVDEDVGYDFITVL